MSTEEDTEPSLINLFGGIICLLFCGGMVISAIVLATQHEGGVGAIVGSVAGALFWGGIGLFALHLYRSRVAAVRQRTERDRLRTARDRDEVAEPLLPLPDGPGMGVRWAMTIPVMLLGIAVVWAGQIALMLWWERDAFSFMDEEESFGASFVDTLSGSWGTAIIPLVTVAGYLLLGGKTIATWRKACVILALLMVGPMVLMGTVSADSLWQQVPNLLFAAGLVWAHWEIGGLATGLLTRPIAMDVVRSSVEIPVPLPDQTTRLRVQVVNLVLDRLAKDDKRKSLTIPLSRLRSATMTRLDEPQQVKLKNGVTLDLPAGSALRIAGDGQRWLLPVDELTGQYLVSAIRLRAAKYRS